MMGEGSVGWYIQMARAELVQEVLEGVTVEDGQVVEAEQEVKEAVVPVEMALVGVGEV